jgi:hypothetical protein
VESSCRREEEDGRDDLGPDLKHVLSPLEILIHRQGAKDAKSAAFQFCLSGQRLSISI